DDGAAGADGICDRSGVAFEQISLAACRIIFRKRGDVLEQRRADGVVEPARRNRLLRLRESGMNIGAKGHVDSGIVSVDLSQVSHYAHIKDPWQDARR